MPLRATCQWCTAMPARMERAPRRPAPTASDRQRRATPHRRTTAGLEPVPPARRTAVRRHGVRATLRRPGIAGRRLCRLGLVAPRSGVTCPERPRFRCTGWPARPARRIRVRARRERAQLNRAGASRTRVPKPPRSALNPRAPPPRTRHLRPATLPMTALIPRWWRRRVGSAQPMGQLRSLPRRRSPNRLRAQAATARPGRAGTVSPTTPPTRPGSSRTPSASASSGKVGAEIGGSRWAAEFRAEPFLTGH